MQKSKLYTLLGFPLEIRELSCSLLVFLLKYPAMKCSLFWESHKYILSSTNVLLSTTFTPHSENMMVLNIEGQYIHSWYYVLFRHGVSRIYCLFLGNKLRDCFKEMLQPTDLHWLTLNQKLLIILLFPAIPFHHHNPPASIMPKIRSEIFHVRKSV